MRRTRRRAQPTVPRTVTDLVRLIAEQIRIAEEDVKTTIPYHLKTLGDPAFVEGRFTGEAGARLHR